MFFHLFKIESIGLNGIVLMNGVPQNFLFKSPKEDSPLKATDFGLSDYIKPGTFTLKEADAFFALLLKACCF